MLTTRVTRSLGLALLLLGTYIALSQERTEVEQGKIGPELRLTREAASNFAQLALKCVRKEYPNKPEHVMNDETDVRSPRSLHPAFYGCFDWHSSVHGHWMLVRLVRHFPDLPEAGEIRASLDQDLTRENILVEVQYLDQTGRKSFERTYGWAWLLKLAEELSLWNDPDAQRWSKNLSPLVRAIVARYKDFLPRQTYPIRTGVHPNTAFGITFALDYARTMGDRELEVLLVERSRSYYEKDADCPVSWEPGGEDFFSPCLMEANLMRRVLSAGQFAKWLHGFLPDSVVLKASRLLNPAVVSDRSDPKIVHLDGLNLSRAWCMMGIASSLPADDRLRALLAKSAAEHARSALGHVASGNYEGEHWLASFATYLLSRTESVDPR